MIAHADQPSFIMRTDIPKPIGMASCPNENCDADDGNGMHLVNGIDNGTTICYECAECGKFIGES